MCDEVSALVAAYSEALASGKASELVLAEEYSEAAACDEVAGLEYDEESVSDLDSMGCGYHRKLQQFHFHRHYLRKGCDEAEWGSVSAVEYNEVVVLDVAAACDAAAVSGAAADCAAHHCFQLHPWQSSQSK